MTKNRWANRAKKTKKNHRESGFSQVVRPNMRNVTADTANSRNVVAGAASRRDTADRFISRYRIHRATTPANSRAALTGKAKKSLLKPSGIAS